MKLIVITKQQKKSDLSIPDTTNGQAVLLRGGTVRNIGNTQSRFVLCYLVITVN